MILMTLHPRPPIRHQWKELLVIFFVLHLGGAIWAYEAGKNPEVRLAQLESRALAVESDAEIDAQIYLNEGLSYLREGKFEQAKEAFESTLFYDPKNDRAVRGLKDAKEHLTSAIVERSPAAEN